jgi:hypothetical protein
MDSSVSAAVMRLDEVGSGTSFVMGPARAVSGGCEDAAAKEVEVGAAVHLPLDRFYSYVSFDGPEL